MADDLPAAAPPVLVPQLRSTPGQTPFPDALRVPTSWRGSSKSPFSRVNTLFDLCEPLLGVLVGGAEARSQIGFYYITRREHVGNEHGMLFADDHPTLAKRPRYDWEPRPDIGRDVFFGWLKPEAKARLEEVASAEA